MLLEIIIWLPICLLIMSFGEYIPHRWFMHKRTLPLWLYKKTVFLERTYDDHALQHHRRYYKVFNHEPDDYGRHLNLKLSLLFDLILVLPVCLVLALFSWVAPVIMALIVIAHCLIWNAIHEEMHIPQSRFFSKWKIYKYLHRYHWLHHKYPGKNYNVVIPFADFVLGTYIGPGKKDKNEPLVDASS